MFNLTSFSLLIGIVAVLVGTGAILFPVRSALGFGIVAPSEQSAYVRATGARDVFIGLVFILLHSTHDIAALAKVCAFTALVSLIDFFLTFHYGKRLNALVHLSATLTLTGYGFLLWAHR